MARHSHRAPNEFQMRRRTNQDTNTALVRDTTLEEIVNSESFIHELSMIRREGQKVKIDNVEMDVDKIDLDHLTKEQARDLKEIEVMQKQIQDMSASVNDINMNDLKLKPDLGYAEGSSQYMKALRYEIVKYQKKIELLKVK